MNVNEQVDFYGKDAAEWLERWDAGQTVWSVKMGGLGPGYEQVIQITAAELVRHMLEANYTFSDEKWPEEREAIEQASFKNKAIKGLGLSGAQYGAALQVALKLVTEGPVKIMTDKAVEDRKIQVNRTFP